jgi:hypothetical protein
LLVLAKDLAAGITSYTPECAARHPVDGFKMLQTYAAVFFWRMNMNEHPFTIYAIG